MGVFISWAKAPVNSSCRRMASVSASIRALNSSAMWFMSLASMENSSLPRTSDRQVRSPSAIRRLVADRAFSGFVSRRMSPSAMSAPSAVTAQKISRYSRC